MRIGDNFDHEEKISKYIWNEGDWLLPSILWDSFPRIVDDILKVCISTSLANPLVYEPSKWGEMSVKGYVFISFGSAGFL